MNRKRYPMLALVAVIVAAGAVLAGVPVSKVLLLGLFLAGPLMMMSMHGGHGGHGGCGGHGGHAGHDTGAAGRDGGVTQHDSAHHHASAAEPDRPDWNDPIVRR